MGWPKGKPRKGHINKDGTPHKAKGAYLDVQDVHDNVRTDAVPIVSREISVDAAVSPKWSSSHYEGSIHGQVGNSAITAVCPKCGYAYADGGHCPIENGGCGWTQPIVLTSYGSNSGRRY